MNSLKSFFEKISYNDNESYRLRTISVIIVMEIIASIMFVIDILYGDEYVMKATALLIVASMIFLIILLKIGGYKIIRALFTLLYIGVTLAFIYYGAGNGEAAYWAFLLPFMLCFVYGLGIGCGVSIVYFVSIIVLLWLPIGPSPLFDYGNEYIVRFPIIYFSFSIAALLIEYIRVITLNRLETSVKELDDLSNIDALTGIENRRSIERRMDEIWALFATKENYISTLLIDVDYFKQYNDHYGHIVGDQALISVARVLSEVVTIKKGYVSRWGGEEFICVLPFLDSLHAQVVAREIIEAIKKEQIPHEASKLDEKYLTVSIGVSTVNETGSTNPTKMIAGADESLYEAKEAGRNRIGFCKYFG